ncbi:MAG: 5'/3'-nucleotidase SurE [Anaerolineales bacterium]|nr:MAG: 5'/3'-nucleotidase SurE [Anaerolineales bacterium]
MKPLILITNDDGIHSPGLAAAAAALDPLGELLIVAPQEQQTSMGRSRTQQCGGDGTITKTTLKYKDFSWDGFGVKATPALAVVHAVKELSDREISLVISGINYGENVATCVTVSGTIGASLEAAEKGLPSMAVSLEIANLDYHSYSLEVDFSAAIHFTRQIAEKMLAGTLPFDADVLKLDIPLGATPDTNYVVTKQDLLVYYQPVIEKRQTLFGSQAKVSHVPSKGKYTSKDTDAYALAEGLVSITPLSLDLTSRGSLDELAEFLGTSVLNQEG